MRKVIILEGVDGSGKSTLARRLHDTCGYEIIKTGPPAPRVNVTMVYLNALLQAIYQPEYFVFDRLHLGEAIYGPLLRGIDRMGSDGLALVERVIAEHGDRVRLIICCPPWDILVKGWRSKDDLVKDEATLRKVCDAYMEHAVRLGVRTYDWTAPDAEEVLKGLLEG